MHTKKFIPFLEKLNLLKKTVEDKNAWKYPWGQSYVPRMSTQKNCTITFYVFWNIYPPSPLWKGGVYLWHSGKILTVYDPTTVRISVCCMIDCPLSQVICLLDWQIITISAVQNSVCECRPRSHWENVVGQTTSITVYIVKSRTLQNWMQCRYFCIGLLIKPRSNPIVNQNAQNYT